MGLEIPTGLLAPHTKLGLVLDWGVAKGLEINITIYGNINLML